ncbi:hypothetical protein H0H93_014236 [Arthromyces matolae]|nr:hypothetical protein H0H93_014236 [Arthromyces matolae]
MTTPPPAAPSHLLRIHSFPISTVFISKDNKRIYSGDSSGLVVITSTSSLRPLTKWNAHIDSLLGVQEWGNRIVTHARDNKLHLWARPEELLQSAQLGSIAQSVGETAIPKLTYSMDVNALNYCRFSLLPDLNDPNETHALVALPNLVDSTAADIWSLPSCERVHAAVGQTGKISLFNSDPNERSKTGIIMSLHVFKALSYAPSSSAPSSDELRLLCAYENGSVVLRRYARTNKTTSVEGVGWEVIWNVKLHKETVMAMCVSRNNDFALTVSADHLVGRYDLKVDLMFNFNLLSHQRLSKNEASSGCTLHRTKHPGNAAIAINDDGRVCAVAGWDGRQVIRLYSARTMKPLGTLKYHKQGCQAIEFAHAVDMGGTEVGGPPLCDDGGLEDDEEETKARSRWLITGGKDKFMADPTKQETEQIFKVLKSQKANKVRLNQHGLF